MLFKHSEFFFDTEFKMKIIKKLYNACTMSVFCHLLTFVGI